MCDLCTSSLGGPKYVNGDSKRMQAFREKGLIGEYEMPREFEQEFPLPSKEILIARIQQFYDHICKWHKEIQGEREQAEKEEGKELDWPAEMLSMDIVDQYYGQFEDVLSDKRL